MKDTPPAKWVAHISANVLRVRRSACFLPRAFPAVRFVRGLLPLPCGGLRPQGWEHTQHLLQKRAMFHPTEDIRIQWTKVVLPPVFLEEELPVTEAASATIFNARREIVRHPQRPRRRACWSSPAPAPFTTPRPPANTPRLLKVRHRRVLRRPAHRHARLL